MVKEILTFGEIVVGKNKFYRLKNPIFVDM